MGDDNKDGTPSTNDVTDAATKAATDAANDMVDGPSVDAPSSDTTGRKLLDSGVTAGGGSLDKGLEAGTKAGEGEVTKGFEKLMDTKDIGKKIDGWANKSGIGKDLALVGLDKSLVKDLEKGVDALAHLGFQQVEKFVQKEVGDLLDGRHLGRVSFSFHTWDEKNKKLIYNQWAVKTVKITEAVNTSYEATVELVAADKNADPTALLGVSCELWAHRSNKGLAKSEKLWKSEGPSAEYDQVWRSWFGIVTEIDAAHSPHQDAAGGAANAAAEHKATTGEKIKKDLKKAEDFIVHEVESLVGGKKGDGPKTTESEHSEGGVQSAVKIKIVPAMNVLTHRTDSRIFQKMTIPDVIEKVINDGLKPFNRTAKMHKCNEYPVVETITQYEETDFNFVSRLMEQLGFTYFFIQDPEHPAHREKFGAEQLVITDDVSGFEVVSSGKDHDQIHFDTGHGKHAALEAVTTIRGKVKKGVEAVTVRDYDWTRPSLEMKTQVGGKKDDPNTLEQYLFRHEANHTDYDANNQAYTKANSDVHAQIAHKAATATHTIATGAGKVLGFAPGYEFTLLGHSEFAGRYLITEIVHTFDDTKARHGEELSHRFDEAYANTFTVVPDGVQLTPKRVAKKPKITSVQTAKVVGPSAEEVHTDEHGRIKVQFHWDRLGKHDENSSAWIRVGQLMGGAGWGFVFLPRVGMEVIVTFINGDPDHPLVTGTVYNGENRTPKSIDGNKGDPEQNIKHADDGKVLPDNKTRSFIRTQSTSGGAEGDWNEISFEDSKGAEQLYIQAQKDYKEFVKNDHEIYVKGNDFEYVTKDQTVHIVGNRTETVDKDETITIKGNRTETVKKDEKITIEGNRHEEVKKDEGVTIDGNQQLTVKKKRSVEVDDDVTEVFKKKHSLEVDDDQGVTIKGKKSDDITGKYAIKTAAGLEISESNGQTDVSFKGGETKVTSAQKITLTVGANTVEISASSIKSTVGGSTITVSASGIKLAMGPSSIEIGPSGVAITGVPKISLNG